MTDDRRDSPHPEVDEALGRPARRRPALRPLRLGIALILAVQCGVGVMAFRSVRGLLSAAQERRKSLEAVARRERLLDLIKDAETGQRGFLLTGDVNYLEPYLCAREEIRHGGEATGRLAGLIVAKMDELEETVALRRAGRDADAIAIVRTHRGRKLMEAIRAEMQAQTASEGAWVRRRNEEVDRSGRRTLLMIPLAGGWCLIAVTLAALVVRRGSACRRESERALARSESKFRAIARMAPDALVMADAAGIIRFWNEAAERTFGYTEAEAIGAPLSILVPERSRSGRGEWLCPDAVPGGTPAAARARELTGLRRNGAEFPVEASLVRFELDGEPHCCAILRDVTERKRAEARIGATQEELARSNRDLEQFAYVASHDLQEPLRMVGSFAQLLGRRYRGRLDATADEYIAFAVDGVHRMQRLINDLLEYSRVGTTGRPFRPTDVDAALDDALANLRAAIAESAAVVTRDPLPTVTADTPQLVQLFQNFVGNALKFRGPEPPQIHVSAERAGAVWAFTVRDNGIGIEPRHAERIFVIFQRLHGKEQYAGTGIGLAICKKIVERHGGRIWLGPADGPGARFHFTLSARAEDAS